MENENSCLVIFFDFCDFFETLYNCNFRKYIFGVGLCLFPLQKYVQLYVETIDVLGTPQGLGKTLS